MKVSTILANNVYYRSKINGSRLNVGTTTRHIHILAKISFSTFIINENKNFGWCNNQTNPIMKHRYRSGTIRDIQICLVVAPNFGHTVFIIFILSY